MRQFEDIYNENYKTMFHVAQKMVGDGEVVADIVQEVFVYLYERINAGKEVQFPKSWLYRATINRCVDYLNKQKRFKSLDYMADFKVEDDSIEKKETNAMVQVALTKLKPQEKALVVLYSEGLSYKEISEVSGIKFTSIGKMLSRTLKKLEQELKTRHHELYK